MSYIETLWAMQSPVIDEREQAIVHSDYALEQALIQMQAAVGDDDRRFVIEVMTTFSAFVGAPAFKEGPWYEEKAAELRALSYVDYLLTPEWKQRREAVLARDNFRCVGCNTTERLNVHHRTYEDLGLESIDQLTTLCQDCHLAVHLALKARGGRLS